MSRARPMVPTGFAGLMAALALVGVGVGYATGAVVRDDKPTAAPSTGPSTTAVPQPAPTTTTTTVAVRTLTGPQCKVLKEFPGVANPSYVAGATSSDDTPSRINAYLPQSNTRRIFTPAALVPSSATNVVFVLPSEDKTVLPSTTSAIVIYYGASEPKPESDSKYPAVVVFWETAPPLAGMERLVAEVITGGSSRCAAQVPS